MYRIILAILFQKIGSSKFGKILNKTFIF